MCVLVHDVHKKFAQDNIWNYLVYRVTQLLTEIFYTVSSDILYSNMSGVAMSDNTLN